MWSESASLKYKNLMLKHQYIPTTKHSYKYNIYIIEASKSDWGSLGVKLVCIYTFVLEAIHDFICMVLRKLVP